MKLLKGFKEFMQQGNAVQMAVAFVLGAAFTAFVTTLTDNLVKPIVGLMLGGGVDAGTLTIDGQTIDFTAIINAFITFFITALVVYFVFVAPMNALQERAKRNAPEELTEQDYLREIRDLLATGPADGGQPSDSGKGTSS